MTLATHVLSPFLLTRALRPLLEASAPSRVIVVASGGMYTEPLDVDALDPEPAAYDGTKTYARCKRAQVVLAEEWTRELLDTGITVNAMHPGWADTPGLRTALPGFSRVVGPLLRTPEEGADTIVWLAAAPDAADLSGLFFLDRRARAKHRLRRTRRPDEAREAARLWRLCIGAHGSVRGRYRRISRLTGQARACCARRAAARPRHAGSRRSARDRGRRGCGVRSLRAARTASGRERCHRISVPSGCSSKACVCSQRRNGPFSCVSTKRCPGSHSTISVRQRTGSSVRGEHVLDRRSPSHRDRSRREDPEAEPRRRERFEVVGVGEERERVLARQRDELGAFDAAQGVRHGRARR